jgi:hypothetical protein
MSDAQWGGAGRRKPLGHRNSHARLINDAMAVRVPGTHSRVAKLDAIVVPNARSAVSLDAAARLACDVEAKLVVLSSKESGLEAVATHFAERLSRLPGMRALIVELDPDYHHPLLVAAETSSDAFQVAKARRDSDLSLKRNLALLLARHLGWGRLLFMDDDVFGVTPQHVRRITHQLAARQFAGLLLREFPDNSVVCHANRYVGGHQDVFLTGALLGVNTAMPSLPFFPDIYNEDWFSFFDHVNEHAISTVGVARQKIFDPFDDPLRAHYEEFGDLLAEGLMTLVGDGDDVANANAGYWSRFMDARYDFVVNIEKRLLDLDTPEAYRALNSTRAASTQLGMISPEICSDFVDAWRRDLARWQDHLKRLPKVSTEDEACAALGLKKWRKVEFANPDVANTSTAEISTFQIPQSLYSSSKESFISAST